MTDAREPAGAQPPGDGPWRVLFVLEWFAPHVGGVETFFGEIVSELARRGHEVTVVTCAVPGAPALERRPGVTIHRIRAPRIAARYLFTLLAIPRAVRAARGVDFVHTSTYNAAIPGWLAAKLTRSPSILSAHEIWDEQWHRLPGLNRWLAWGYRIFERLVMALPFDHYHTCSAYTGRRLVAKLPIRPEQVSVVYDPVDYDFWDRPHEPADLRARFGLAEDAFVYLAFGRPGLAKGMEFLVEAAATIAVREPRARLVLLLSHEPANQYHRIRARIRELGLSDHVHLIDPVPRAELPGILLGADCVVVPSLLEGFGYAAVETAILGQRLVTTLGHSVEEVVEGAAFVPPGDPAALAGAILAVAAGGRPVARPSQRFDVPTRVAEFMTLYRGVLRQT